MKKIFGVIAITTAALATTAAYAENAADEKRAKLNLLWAAGDHVTASQTIPSGANFAAPSKSYNGGASHRWVETYTTNNERDRAGR